MILQDRAKRTMFYHDLGKDSKINHVLDKRSMVAIAFLKENSALNPQLFIQILHSGQIFHSVQ